MEHVKNGLEDRVINDFFQQEIEDVQKSELGKIKIEYYDIDLNDDGRTDRSFKKTKHAGYNKIIIISGFNIDRYRNPVVLFE